MNTERTFIEVELKDPTENWMPWDQIPFGTVFVGNPCAKCPSPPYYSGALGASLYIKTIEGYAFSLTGARNFGMEKLDKHWFVENYRPLNKIKIVETL